VTLSPQTIRGDIRAPPCPHPSPGQRRCRNKTRPARLRSFPIQCARPHLDSLEHPRPRPRRNGVDRQPHRRLSRRRREKDRSSRRVERVQDRAPSRASGFHPHKHRYGLCGYRRRTHAQRSDGPTCGTRECAKSRMGSRRAGGRTRGEFSASQNSSSSTVSAVTITSYRIHAKLP
jgi:hypothetical protein